MAHHHHGGSGGATELAHGTMTAFLHLNPGDTLWLSGWVPGRSSTLWGACVALILLGIGERWVAAARASVERAIAHETYMTPEEKEKIKEFSLPKVIFLLRGAAPFVLSHAWARGALQMVQSTLGFLFMLAVMTYQVGFILSIVLGLGVGEMMYGRYTEAAYANIGY